MDDLSKAKLGGDALDAGGKIVGGILQKGAADQQYGTMQKSAKAIEDYRPQIANARMNALRQSMTAYEGPNRILAAMEGKGGQGVNLGAFGNNPMGNMSPVAVAQPAATGAPAPGAGAPPGGHAEIAGMDWHWNPGGGNQPGYFYYGPGGYVDTTNDPRTGHSEYFKHYDKDWKELPG